jgi:peroxiredoxin Q/BCP
LPLDVGDRVPSFTLPDQHGQPFRLDEALAKGPVVLFFYPKDFTSGCTAEACSFRDARDDFAEAGAQVVGVSSDDVASHKGFADAHRLDYPLLADEGGRVRAQFGVQRALFGLTDGRVTFVVDRDGVIRHRFDSLVRATRHVHEALETVRQLGRVEAR